MRVYYDYSSYGDSYHSTEEWGEWWSRESVTYNHVSLTGKYSGIDIDFEPQVGDFVYLVAVTYGSGDSFGYSEGNEEVLGIYKDEETAKRLVGCIKNDLEEPSSYGSKGPFHEFPDVRTYIWKGYFESFEACTIHKLEVKP